MSTASLKIELLDDQPMEFRGSAKNNLPELINKMQGEKLCISLLLDLVYCEENEATQQPEDYSMPGV